MSEDRFEAIESQLAHQEVLLQELNDVLTAQQQDIMRLEAQNEALRSRIRALSESVPAEAAQDETPPHY